MTEPVPIVRDPGRRITVGEISARRGVALDVQGDVTEASPLISGQIIQRLLPDGLQIHGGDTVEEQAFRVDSSISDGLSCIFFLRGDVDVAIGGRDFRFHARGAGDIAASALLSGAEESFRRQSATRQRVTHLVIGASGDWLRRHAPDWSGPFTDTARRAGLASRSWQVTAHASRLIGGMLSPQPVTAPFANLYAEAHAIEIIAEAITALTGEEATPDQRFTDRHRLALNRARDFILAHADGDLSVDVIAKQAGVSASGLQALFRAFEGCGVYTFVRIARLERARARLEAGEIDIAQASLLAGYTNPANFTTAFRRHFGCTPRHLRRQRLS